MKGSPQVRSLVSRANTKHRPLNKTSASPKPKTANLISHGNENHLQQLPQTENMVVDSPMEMASLPAHPPLPFHSTGEHASAQTPELSDENMSEVMNANGMHNDNNGNFGGADMVVNRSADTRHENVTMVSSVEAVFYSDSNSVRRCASVSHQMILVSTSNQMGGPAPFDSTDVEMFGPPGSLDETLHPSRAVSRKRKH